MTAEQWRRKYGLKKPTEDSGRSSSYSPSGRETATAADEWRRKYGNYADSYRSAARRVDVDRDNPKAVEPTSTDIKSRMKGRSAESPLWESAAANYAKTGKVGGGLRDEDLPGFWERLALAGKAIGKQAGGAYIGTFAAMDNLMDAEGFREQQAVDASNMADIEAEKNMYIEESAKRGYEPDANILEYYDRLIADAGEQVASYDEAIENVHKRTEKAYERATTLTTEGLEAQDLAKYGIGTVGSFLVDTGIAGGQMLADMAVGTVTGMGGTAAMLTRVFGSSVSQAAADGASLEEQMYEGIKGAALEFVSERLFGGNPVYDRDVGLVNRIVAAVLGEDSGIVRALASKPVEVLGEGLEEIFTSVFDPIVNRVANSIDGGDRDTSAPAVADLLYEGAIGTVLGGAGTAVQTAVNSAGQAAQAKRVYGSSQTELVNEALDINPDNEYAQKMRSRLDEGKNLRGDQLNRLVKQNDEAIKAMGAEEYSQALEAAGVAQEDGDVYAEDEYSAEEAGAQETAQKPTEATPLMEAAKKYGDQAKVMESVYKEGQDLTAFDRAFSRAFEIAKNGGSRDYVMASDAFSALSPAQREAAFEAGTNEANRVDLKTISGVSARDDGSVVITTADGREVDVGEAYIPSAGGKAVVEAVSEMGLDGSTALSVLKFYGRKPIKAASYVESVNAALRTGKVGAPMSGRSALSEDLRAQVYEAGIRAGEAQAKAAAKAARESGASRAESGVRLLGLDERGLKPAQKAGYEAAKFLSEAVGASITIVDGYNRDGKRYFRDADGTERLFAGGGKNLNGWYDTNTGAIYLDIHAGRDYSGTVLYTLGHEMTHFIKQWSPAKYRTLSGYLYEQMAMQGQDVDAMIIRKMAGGKNSYEAAAEEVVADAMESILVSGDAAKMISDIRQKDAGLADKILRFLKDFVKKLKHSLGAYRGKSPDSVEGSMVAEMEENVIRKLESLWAEAAVDAGDAYSRAAEMSNEEAFEDSSAAILSQIRPPFSTKSKAFADFAEGLSEDARKTFDMFYNFYEGSRLQNVLNQNGKRVKAINISSVFMTTQQWNDKLASDEDWRNCAQKLAEQLPGDVRRAMNMNLDGTLSATPLEAEFKMARSLAQRLVDALPFESIDSTYQLGDKVIRLPAGKSSQSVGGEAYRRAILKATRDLYASGNMKFVSIGAMTKDIWGSLGFLATNGKTGASGDFTTLCPQMMYNRGCYYCYRRAAMESGVNNKLVAEKVWYTGEILRLKQSDIERLNRNGGLRIQSFGDWSPQFSAQLADLLYDAETRGLQIKIITKEPSMIEYVAALKEQGIGKNLYFNLSADYAIEKAPGQTNRNDPASLDYTNPARPHARIDGEMWWKRAMTVEEASTYREKYDWVNVRIVATTTEEFLRGLRDPRVDVVTGYHGHVRSWARIDSETGEKVVNVEPLGDAGMPVFMIRKDGSWVTEYDGKTKTHQALAKAIADAGLQFEYYIKTCCITGRCASCNGKCGALAKEFAVKNATNRDEQSIAYWQEHMFSAEGTDENTGEINVSKSAQAAVDRQVAEFRAEQDSHEGVMYSDRDTAPTFYSHMERVVEGVKQEKLGASSVVNMLRGKGVKAEEIKWSGIEQFLEGKKSVTKQELLEFMRGNRLEVEEGNLGLFVGQKVTDWDLGIEYESVEDWEKSALIVANNHGYNESEVEFKKRDNGNIDLVSKDSGRVITSAHQRLVDETKWSDYALDGGSNYREILFRLPGSEYSNPAMQAHWGDAAKGVLAHARVQDFDTPDGKMLFVEEIQSDWHNEGQRKGYAKALSKEDQARVDSLEAEADRIREERNAVWVKIRAADPLDPRTPDYYSQVSAFSDQLRAVRDELFGIYGSEPRGSFDLPAPAGVPDAPFRNNYHEFVLKRLIREAAEQGYDSIGWTTGKVQEERWSSEYAEGYRIEYDQDIPKFLNKYGKKWGAKVGKTMLQTKGASGFVVDGEEYTSYSDALDAVIREANSALGYRGADRIKSTDVTTKTEDGDIVVYDNIGVELGRIGRRAETTEVWSMPITDSMKESVMTEGQPLYSDRDAAYLYQDRPTESVSNRSLLANALDSAVQNEAEQRRLDEYRANIDSLNEQEARLSELNAQIREKSFAKGPRDTAGLNALRDEKVKTVNRINTIDGSLLRLEAAKPLQDLLAREKAKAYARAKSESRQAQKEYRAKAEERLAAQRQEFREKQKADAETRRERDARNKYKARIEKDVADLNNWLLHPSSKDVTKHIPDVLKKPVIEFISGIDFSSKRRLSGGEDTNADREFIKKLTAVQSVLAHNGDSSNKYASYLDLPPDFMETVNDFVGKVTNLAMAGGESNVVNRMSASELKDLSGIVRTLKSLIQKFNRYHANAMFEHVYDAGNNSISYMAKIKDAGPRTGNLNNFVVWQNIRPAYAFERFGKGGESVYDELRRGQAKLAFNAEEIIQFAESAYTAQEVKQWEDEVKEVELGGDTVVIPVSHIMSFYELTKRPQALTHILGEGIRVATYTKGGKKISDVGHMITPGEMQTLIGLLSDRQIEVADALQKYMAEKGGKWGNHVSVARFGEEMFGEKEYFPINSDGRHLMATADESPGSASLYSLLNMSFTKELKENANNRIVLYSIFDVFANHMSSMAQYNAMALPVVDALKWLNYKQIDLYTGEVTTSVRDQMSRAYGTPEEASVGKGQAGYAEKFVVDILKAFNGTEAQNNDAAQGLVKWLKRYNYAQVAWNFSVVAQQPSAITRAGLVINPKYLVRGAAAKGMKASIAEMEKYSGIAKWKAMGFYDVNVSRGVSVLIKHKETFRDKYMEVGMAGAEAADKATWAAIWNACKLETADKNRDISTGSKEFFDLVSDRFEEVIYKTQVVDSVLTRSSFLRNKGVGAKMFSSFMSEPTTTASMIIHAAEQINRAARTRGESFRTAWGKYGSYMGRAIAAYVMQAAVNSAIHSALVGAPRDDDEYQSYWQKFLEHFTDKFTEELSPLGKLPYFPEAEEVVKQIGAELFDWDVFATPQQTIVGNIVAPGLKLATRLNELFNKKDTNYTKWAALFEGLKLVGSATGFALYQPVREIQTLWNNTVAHMAPSLKIVTYDAGPKNEIKYSFLDGYITEEEAAAYLLEQNVVEDEEEAVDMVGEWAYYAENPNAEISWSSYNKWQTYAEPAGVSEEMFQDVLGLKTSLTGTGSVKEPTMAYIDGLRITDEQKDALYYAMGWSENTIDEAPWR